MAKMYHQRIIPKLAQVDGELLSGLEKAGFKAWSGPEGSGFLMSKALSNPFVSIKDDS